MTETARGGNCTYLLSGRGSSLDPGWATQRLTKSEKTARYFPAKTGLLSISRKLQLQVSSLAAVRKPLQAGGAAFAEGRGRWAGLVPEPQLPIGWSPPDCPRRPRVRAGLAGVRAPPAGRPTLRLRIAFADNPHIVFIPGQLVPVRVASTAGLRWTALLDIPVPGSVWTRVPSLGCPVISQ